MNSANTTPTSREQWLERAAQLSIRGQAFIDGNYADAASGQTFACISPIDGKVIAAVAQCEAEDVERAVSESRRAFDAGRWSTTAPVHRNKVLLRFAPFLDRRREKLALLETLPKG